MSRKIFTSFLVLALVVATTSVVFAAKGGGGGGSGGGSGKPPSEAGNNLSYPVIWAEGVTKILPGTLGMTPILDGEWWYQWGTNGTDPNITPASCPPDPDESKIDLNPNGDPYCDDNITDSLTQPAGIPDAQNPLPLAKVYLQKDIKNVWQAGSADWSTAPVNVHWIDWGDNLESVDWYTRSQVRTEVVLFQDLVDPMLEYEMRHTSGWGIDEVHGLAATLDGVPVLGPGNRATVYSHCARLTIQKLLVERDNPLLADLIWVSGEGWTEPDYVPGSDPTVPYPYDLINPQFFNDSVHEAGDGPGYYSAEINVKGRIIYGYTWNVRKLNELTGTPPTAAGDYRITFSFDEVCGIALLNTFFAEGVTQIMVPLEEEAAIEAEPIDEGGATAVLVPAEYDEFGELIGGNLTYIDVRILERGGGGGGRP